MASLYCMRAPSALASFRRPTIVARPHKPSRTRILGPVCFRENEKAAQQQQQAESVEQKVESKVTETTEKVARKVSGFMSDPNKQAMSYWYLGTAALTTALCCLAAPGPFASFMFGGATDPVVNTLVRAAGATLVTSAAVKYTLKEAAVRNQLYMDTFKRLNVGLVLQTGATLVIAAQAISLRNNLLTGYMALVCAPGLLLASRMFALYKQQGGLPLPSLTKTVAGMLGVLMPRNLTAAVYSLLTIAFAGMAAMSLSAAPGAAMKLYQGFHGPMTVFAERSAGAGLMLMTLVAYSLKDGADRGKLGATTFRWLNLGLAGSLLSMVWYFSSDYETGLLMHTAKSLGMMGSIVAAFMWCGYQYIAGTSTSKTHAT